VDKPNTFAKGTRGTAPGEVPFFVFLLTAPGIAEQ